MSELSVIIGNYYTIGENLLVAILKTVSQEIVVLKTRYR